MVNTGAGKEVYVLVCFVDEESSVSVTGKGVKDEVEVEDRAMDGRRVFSCALRGKRTRKRMSSSRKSRLKGDEGQGGGGCTVVRAGWSCLLVGDVDGSCSMCLATSLLDGICILYV